ncbi:hypothetical protein [Desulfoferula mesophila]|uniref:Uncharacterized protein n=1 Tax=Desulfoferula mesophila TaxID=3058419 RepID=A0AAU9ESS0_9BACT|nr:hypothetical protein FAK_38770 [Desulfoferula mesophilus]
MTRIDRAGWPGPWLIFFLPLALALVLIGIKFQAPILYYDLVQEDGLLEYAQFACYAAAGVLCLFAAARLWGRAPAGHFWVVLLLGLGLLLVAGEEISWGERLLGYALPQWFAEHNTQREVSLHNLKAVQGKISFLYVVVGLALGLSWRLWRRPAAWLRLGPAWRSLLELVVPPWSLSLYFLPTALLYGYFIVGFLLALQQGTAAGFGQSGLIYWRDQEPAEMLLSLGFLLWAAHTLGQVIQGRRLPRPGAVPSVLDAGIKQP